MATPPRSATATSLDLQSIAQHVDEVETAARAVLRAWSDFTNSDIRVGPVYPRMRDLYNALGVPIPKHLQEEY